MLATDWVIVSPSFKERSSRRQSRKAIKEPTPGFALPSEIRMKIYKYALASPEALTLVETEKGRLRLAHIYQPTFPWSRFYLAKQLLLVSRKTYEEAADVLYGENTFRFVYDMETIQQLLEKLLPSTRSCIKRINFQGSSSLNYQSIRIDAQLEQLCKIRNTLATQDPGFRLQCMGLDGPIMFSQGGDHKARLKLALGKLFLLKVAKTIKFSGYCGTSWQEPWNGGEFARLVECCLDEQEMAAQVSCVVEDDTFAQQRSSVIVTFV